MLNFNPPIVDPEAQGEIVARLADPHAESRSSLSCRLNNEEEGKQSSVQRALVWRWILGAIMLLFEGYFGNVLHTRDCRLSTDCLANLPRKLTGKSNKASRDGLDYLYLDCTFGRVSFRMPSRNATIKQDRRKFLWRYQELGSKIYLDRTTLPEIHKHHKPAILCSTRELCASTAMKWASVSTSKLDGIVLSDKYLNAKGSHGLLIIVIHAAMLESGFVCFDIHTNVPRNRFGLPEGWGTKGTLEKDVFELWKFVKDTHSLPVLTTLREKVGLPSPPSLVWLPIELKLKVLEFLPAVDIAKVGCVCKELQLFTAMNSYLPTWTEGALFVLTNFTVSGKTPLLPPIFGNLNTHSDHAHASRSLPAASTQKH
eukprot:Gb_34344 [translate_table: standard]